jgi:NitT/TauT family transport system permease protein
MRVVLSSHSPKGFLAYLGLPAFLFVWSALSYSNLVNPLLLPPPDRVILAARDIGFPLAAHFVATLIRVIGGFLGAVLLGSTIGVLMQYNRCFYGVMDGLIETWRPVPAVALVPFFILIFGFSEAGRLLLVVLGTALVVVVTVVESLERVPPSLIRLGLIAGLPRSKIFRLILIPAAAPFARAGFRIALALSITLVVVSEFLGSRYGLGYLINVSKVTLTTSTMFLCIILLGLVGFILDFGLRKVFGAVSVWEYSSREAMR